MRKGILYCSYSLNKGDDEKLVVTFARMECQATYIWIVKCGHEGRENNRTRKIALYNAKVWLTYCKSYRPVAIVDIFIQRPDWSQIMTNY